VNDELQRRIKEHVLNGDAPSIIWAMEGQIRINTKLEAKLAELERREALLTAFVVAYKAHENNLSRHTAGDWSDPQLDDTGGALFDAECALESIGIARDVQEYQP
jgi:hypothetical protein